ncbi:hypothetical protein ACOME3_007859 [Neoechinorhynchus agilis]
MEQNSTTSDMAAKPLVAKSQSVVSEQYKIYPRVSANDVPYELNVSTSLSQGKRNHMEDYHCITSRTVHNSFLNRDIQYTYLAVFDGHGGTAAAEYANQNLVRKIEAEPGFFSGDESNIAEAIVKAFAECQRDLWNNRNMWKENMEKVVTTAGTTATVVVIIKSKMFVANVGDSSAVLGLDDDLAYSSKEDQWLAMRITTNHRLTDAKELSRILQHGGQLFQVGSTKKVSFQPRSNLNKRKPENPLLALSRALGDLWSYNKENGAYIVSPVPDIRIFDINPYALKCIVIATDGLWDVMNPQEVIGTMQQCNCRHDNAAAALLHNAIDRWAHINVPADNVSIICVRCCPIVQPRSHDYVREQIPLNMQNKSININKQVPTSGGLYHRHNHHYHHGFDKKAEAVYKNPDIMFKKPEMFSLQYPNISIPLLMNRSISGNGKVLHPLLPMTSSAR